MKKNGFSLIELLAVILILGVVSSIGVIKSIEMSNDEKKKEFDNLKYSDGLGTNQVFSNSITPVSSFSRKLAWTIPPFDESGIVPLGPISPRGSVIPVGPITTEQIPSFLKFLLNSRFLFISSKFWQDIKSYFLTYNIWKSNLHA